MWDADHAQAGISFFVKILTISSRLSMFYVIEVICLSFSLNVMTTTKKNLKEVSSFMWWWKLRKLDRQSLLEKEKKKKINIVREDIATEDKGASTTKNISLKIKEFHQPCIDQSQNTGKPMR